MNSAQHVIIGATGTYLVLLLLTGFKMNINSTTFGLVLFATLGGSLLPDILEPPRQYTHRNKYHSRKTLKRTSKASGLLFIIVAIPAFIGFGVSVLFAPFSFAFSYFLHLLADSTTPMGLPKQ